MTTGLRAGAGAYASSRRSMSSRVIDRDSVLRRLDWVLLLAVGGLLVMGASSGVGRAVARGRRQRKTRRMRS